jgi:error-prone DNA polymerase
VSPVTYAELHCHSAYSFKEGASTVWDILLKARDLGLEAVALTDHDNLCGAMEFARSANALGVKPIIGVELTLCGGGHVTLLAETLAGYRNICRLVTEAHMSAAERTRPELDPSVLARHAEGVICLSGCARGELALLVSAGEMEAARRLGRQYRDWFGPERYYIELQQNLVKGDTARIRGLAAIAGELDIPVVATNNVHYHVRERHRLHDALVAIQHNRSLEETHRERRATDEFFLKSPPEMAALFCERPEAIENAVSIGRRCTFDLTRDPIYQFPEYESLPPGETQLSYLRGLCQEAAVRRYGGVTHAVRERLDSEFALIEKHGLAGYLLQYHDIIKIAREVQEDLGLVEKGLPVEVQPPGRGRGSSVALLVGYLIGLSHIDPLQFNLKLDRFIPSDRLSSLPDIDLDFPREIREELILRVHRKWGYEKAVLTGMIATYKSQGAVRDLGKALGLPAEDVDRLSKSLDGHFGSGDIAAELRAAPGSQGRTEAPLWRDLAALARELTGLPKYLAQHPGGMVLSAKPLSEVVPLQRGAIEGRYICQWDKDSIDDARFVKIDFLALGALSQMTEALELIKRDTEERVDLSRINFEDPAVYADIHAGDTVGVFQIESAAQIQTVGRIKPVNLTDMAIEVGAVRPGVGVNDGVTLLIRRRSGIDPDWQYDHPLERPALERTYGVPLYQDQLMELAIHVAGMPPSEADQMRRAFSRKDRDRQVPHWREKFMAGAAARGVPQAAAEKIFRKFNGEYQFPEAHAFAFGITAFQMAWLKHYHPLEFFTGLYNNQPMGFYNLETLKEDAKRHGVRVLNPDVNRSGRLGVIDEGAIRMGLTHVAKIKEATAEVVLAARSRHGPFKSLGDFMQRTGLLREQVECLVRAGAFDCFAYRAGSARPFESLRNRAAQLSQPAKQNDSFAVARSVADRRGFLWETGLRYRPVSAQLTLDLPVAPDMAVLPEESDWDRMMGEYRTLGVHPSGHIIGSLRWALPAEVVPSNRLDQLPDGAKVAVAGLVVRRQRPLAKAVFMTLEDEHGHSPLVIWPAVYERLRTKARAPVLIARGIVSRRGGAMNIVVNDLEPVPVEDPGLKSKDWG